MTPLTRTFAIAVALTLSACSNKPSLSTAFADKGIRIAGGKLKPSSIGGAKGFKFVRKF